MRIRRVFVLVILGWMLAACAPAAPQEPAAAVRTVTLPPATAQATVVVETPAPTPTTTPDLQSTPAGADLVVFIGQDGNLQLYASYRRAVVPITTQGGAVDLALSPDHSLVLYRRAAAEGVYELWLAPVDGSGERELVNAEALAALDPAADAVSVLQYQWLPDSRGFLFNTMEVISTGPGQHLYEDLQRYDLDADAFTPVLPAGSGGGQFAISPDGSLVAFSKPSSAGLVGLDGEGLATDLVTFPQVLTYSEYAYSPELIWERDSTAFWVVVPPSDPLEIPVRPAMVYRVAVAGGSEQVALLPGADFFGGEMLLSADFSMAAFIRSQGDPRENVRELVLARFDGSEPQVLTSVKDGRLDFAWAPGAQELLVAADGVLYRAQVISADVRMEEVFQAQELKGLRWLGDRGFLAWALQEGGWSLVLGDFRGGPLWIVEGFDAPTEMDARIEY